MKLTRFFKLTLCTFMLTSMMNSLLWGHKVGLCIVATGRYYTFAQQLIVSARKHFCKNHNVTYFVFTDGPIMQAPDVVKIYQKRLGWPYDTLMRDVIYDQYKEKLGQMDYLFATDADMLFVANVGDEVLTSLVATQHPGYIGHRGTYERNQISTAYVRDNEGTYYFAGGFYGGTSQEFLKMVAVITDNIKKDLEKDFIAVWHDESHKNRYFIDNPPTLVLSPSYCYPENWKLPYHKKLLALDKDHAKLRK